MYLMMRFFFFFSSRRRHTRLTCDWSSDVCSSDLDGGDGGDGGDVIVRAVAGTDSLADIVNRKHWRAESGGRGGPANCHGRKAGGLGIPGPAGGRGGGPGRGEGGGGPEGGGGAGDGGPGGPGRPGEQVVRLADQPGPAADPAGHAGRGALGGTRAEGDRRRGAGRTAQRGQVHPAEPAVAGPAGGGGLPV